MNAYGAPVSTPSLVQDLAQRAQAEPAGLLGARLNAFWGSDKFPCTVVMIRHEHGRFEACVEYEDTVPGMRQWEVIGEAPWSHTLLKEPSEVWHRTGSDLIGKRVNIATKNGSELRGSVMWWLPADGDDVAFYKVLHDDGDFEDMDFEEVQAAILVDQGVECVAEGVASRA